MLRPPPLGFESVGAPFQQATNQSEYDQENDSNLLMSWSNLLSLPNQDWIIFYSLFQIDYLRIPSLPNGSPLMAGGSEI